MPASHHQDSKPRPDLNPVEAYIFDPPQESMQYPEPMDYGNTITWRYSDNPKEIIDAPIDDVIFLDPNDDKNHSGIRQKILDRTNIDPLFLKPKLDIYRGYEFEENTKTLADYIKDTGCNFNYKNLISDPIYSDEKDRLNNAQLYIRPTKKLLEYNPILAKRQYQIRHSLLKKKKIIPYGLALAHLQAVQYELQKVLRYNLDLDILYREGWKSSRRKSGISYFILILIDFYNMFFPKNSYRNFEKYKELIKIWKDTPKEKRELYPKEFIKWMNSEEKIKPRPTQTQRYDIIKKPKLSTFKISK